MKVYVTSKYIFMPQGGRGEQTSRSLTISIKISVSSIGSEDFGEFLGGWVNYPISSVVTCAAIKGVVP